MNHSILSFLVLKLNEIGGIKFGSFKLKSGIQSPIYIDLRVLVGHPTILESTVELMYQAALKGGADAFDLVCGVPYTALPMATVISLKHNIPMLMVRKEAKDHGTKQLVEGSFRQGQRCLVIEDIVTSGDSVIGVAEILKRSGVQVTDLTVFLDREQGGDTNIRNKGYRLHSVIKISKVLDILKENGRITQNKFEEVTSFLKGNIITRPVQKHLTYLERSNLSVNPAGKLLLKLMHEKKTNLCLAADVCSKGKLLELVSLLGPEICMLKLHVDIIEDFDLNFIVDLKKLATEHRFLIFEDRKFADIGNTVKMQYTGGIYKIVQWADITNSHVVSGASCIASLREDGLPKNRGLLLLAQMSTSDSNIGGDSVSISIDIAKRYPDFVFGFISQEALIPSDPSFVYCAPGVNLLLSSATTTTHTGKGDGRGQNYNSPEEVIRKGVDVIIVGRGIIESKDPLTTAKQYREAGWSAYLKRIGSSSGVGVGGTTYNT